MGINYREGIAILELVAYPPLLVCSVYLSWKFGWRSASACWRYVIVLCLLRIIAGSCTVALASNYSITLLRAALVCDLIGVSPLLMMGIGLISQVNKTALIIPHRRPTLLHILSLIALTLGIAGVSTSSNSDNYHSSGLVKAAIIIFLVVFAGLVGCIAYMTICWSQLSTRDQRKAVIALWISVPFLLVRLLYSTIADLSNDTAMFSEIDGNSTVYLCMSVLEEIIVAAVHVGFGLTYQKGGFGDPPSTDPGMDQGAELEGNSSKGSR